MGSGSPSGGKSPAALRTIGEVVAETGVAAHVLRYWERQITALQPVRRAGDRRYYRAADVALISEIARLINDEGYTLDGAARAATRRGADAGGPSGQGDALGGAAPTDTSQSPSHTPAQGRLVAGSGDAQGRDGAVSLARLRQLRDRLQNALDQNG